MQGVGNDFVVLDGIGQQVALTPERAENDLNCGVWLTGPAATVFEGEIQID